MSTRATIAVRRPSGDYLAVYLHYDGYPEHAGRLLAAHYQTSEEVETLIAGGDIRSLDAEIGEADRFSNGPAASVLPTHDSLVDFAKNCGAAFLYVFDDDRSVGHPDRRLPKSWQCQKLSF
jgi:hypothetical protein